VITKERLTIKLETKGDAVVERREALKKGDLFRKVFALELAIENKDT
jgi:hypothetical protein